MPFALLIIGLILIISAARGTFGDLGRLLKEDLTGEKSFLYWIVAIGVVGMIGYSKPAEKFSRAFMALILLAMILSNKGFFRQLVDAIGSINSGTAPGSGAAGNTLDNSTSAQQTAQASRGGQGGSGAQSAPSAYNPLDPNAIAGQFKQIISAGGSTAQLVNLSRATASVIRNPISAVTGFLGKLF